MVYTLNNLGGGRNPRLNHLSRYMVGGDHHA